MYKQIAHPRSGQKFSIYSKEGKTLIRNYLNQIGGTVQDEEGRVIPSRPSEPTPESPNPFGDHIATKEESIYIRSYIGPMCTYASQKVHNMCKNSKVISSAVYEDTLASAEFAIIRYNRNPDSIEEINSVLVFGPLLELYMEVLLNQWVGERARIMRIKEHLKRIILEVRTKVPVQKGGMDGSASPNEGGMDRSAFEAVMRGIDSPDEGGMDSPDEDEAEADWRRDDSEGQLWATGGPAAAGDIVAARVPDPYLSAGGGAITELLGDYTKAITTMTKATTKGGDMYITGLQQRMVQMQHATKLRTDELKQDIKDLQRRHKLTRRKAQEAGEEQFESDLLAHRSKMMFQVFIPVSTMAIMGAAGGYVGAHNVNSIVGVVGDAVDGCLNGLNNSVHTVMAGCFNPIKTWLGMTVGGCNGNDFGNWLWDDQTVDQIRHWDADPSWTVNLGPGGVLPSEAGEVCKKPWGWFGKPVCKPATTISMCVGYNRLMLGGGLSPAASVFWTTACVGGGACCCAGLYLTAKGRSAAQEGVIAAPLAHATAGLAMASGVGVVPGMIMEACTWLTPGSTTIREVGDYCSSKVPNNIAGLSALPREQERADDPGFQNLNRFKTERAWSRRRYLQYVAAQHQRSGENKVEMRAIAAAREFLEEYIKKTRENEMEMIAMARAGASERDRMAIEGQAAASTNVTEFLIAAAPALQQLEAGRNEMHRLMITRGQEARAVLNSGALDAGVVEAAPLSLANGAAAPLSYTMVPPPQGEGGLRRRRGDDPIGSARKEEEAGGHPHEL